MKVYQWRMNTKLEAESKDNRLQIAEQTILSQNFELGQLRTQVETVSRSFMLKSEELTQVQKDMALKMNQSELLSKAIDIVLFRMEKQEIAINKAKELDESHTDAVVQLTERYVQLKTQMDRLEKAREQVDIDLQAANNEIAGFKQALCKSEEQSHLKIDSLEKLVSSKEEEKGELEKKILKANDEIDAKEREVDNFKALRHRELREKDDEIRSANEKITLLEDILSQSKASEEDSRAKIDNFKKLIICKDRENEELEKRVNQASNDCQAKQQELDNSKALRHKELREKGEELQTSKKEISRLTEILGKLEEESNSKIENLKKLVNCKDREIDGLEKNQQHLIQEQKEFIEARSIDYDTELRKKSSLIQNLESEMTRLKIEHKTELESLKEENEARSVDYDVELRKKDCRIRDLEAAMSDMKEKHRAEMKDLNDSNEAMVAKTKKLAIDKEKDTGEMKQRLEQKKRAEVTEEEQEWQSFKTPSFRDGI